MMYGAMGATDGPRHYVDGKKFDILEITILKLLVTMSPLSREVAHRNLSGLVEFRTGSLCSGSGMGHIVAKRVIGLLCPDLPVRCVYACAKPRPRSKIG